MRDNMWDVPTSSYYTLCNLTDCCTVLKAAGSPTLSEPLASKTSVTAYQAARSYVLETANVLFKFFIAEPQNAFVCSATSTSSPHGFLHKSDWYVTGENSH